MSGKNDIEDDRIARMAKELTSRKKSRVLKRRNTSLAQATYDALIRHEAKEDARAEAAAKKDTYLKTLEGCYVKDKKFLRGIIFFLIIALLMALGVIGADELKSLIPFI